MKLSLFTLCFIILLCINCEAQIGNFKKALIKPKIGQVVKYQDKESDSEITYLGNIKGDKGELVYYVLKEFYRIQGAQVMRGHSRIVFLDKDQKLVAVYRIDMPGDLPNRLINNSLYFEYVDENDNKRKNHLEVMGLVLPDYICIKPNADCYSKKE